MTRKDDGAGRRPRRPARRGPAPSARREEADSEQTIALPRPVVSATLAGAHRLASVYWEEVEAAMHGLVSVRRAEGAVELRLLTRGPVLLCFGAPALDARPGSVTCVYPITGGLLARTRGGALSFVQERRAGWRLRTAVRGFAPRLAALPGRPRWTGWLYANVQARIHAAVGRRYAARLLREAGR